MNIDDSKGIKNLNENPSKEDTGSNNMGELFHKILEKEEALKTIINNSHIVLFLLKNEDKWPVEFVSENVVNLGYTVEDFTSGRVMYRDIIYADDLEEVRKEFEKNIKNKVSAFSIEYRILTKT